MSEVRFHTGCCASCGNVIEGIAPGGRAQAPLCERCAKTETKATDTELEIIIRGKADCGKTTIASLIREYLTDQGFKKLTFEDIPSPDPKNKARFSERLERNMNRTIRIKVELKP